MSYDQWDLLQAQMEQLFAWACQAAKAPNK